MTQDEIIRMAREAGYISIDKGDGDVGLMFTQQTLKDFAALVAAHEREACVKVCEEEAEEWSGRTEPHEAVVRCAAAIRARSQHE